MPILTTLEPNPKFKPAHGQGETYEAIKKKGPIPNVSFITATEAVANSKGMYRIKEATTAPAIAAPAMLDDMNAEQLKEAAIGLGITIRKQKVSKADLLQVIREQLSQIEVTDE